MDKTRILSLPPVLPEKPRVLILGSIPGVQSLTKQQYYGNPRNHFWTIMSAIFNDQLPENYETRLNWIKEKQIALWDTIGSCTRPGSLDSNIRDEQPNAIPELIEQYPTIERILCNGGKSWSVFQKHFGKSLGSIIEVRKLPSTSPVPGRYTKTLEEKIIIWKDAVLES
ncbi:DNA-deoxyinosine glycosylase [Aciduricibacillus chroicocephali]|uniref:DNA-deoxyinosine glycosylase n=1 Tax=Aciduricibacillus chroicocephali TaxID=3054939 RepID=A0ABY9KX76_9BACI|nr:DNA-deoxyinosine glycosylase [Bacillaceae bacterium 44XB]